MTFDRSQLILLPFSRFKIAILGIFLVSLILRFWQLSQFNVLVFDEVYYAKFANYYWLGKPFFGSHPPLGHYLIAIAIGIGSLFPASPDTINDLTGSLRSTWSYRWLNALTGSFVPLLVGAIAYELTSRRRFTLIIMALAALDGLFLVESRYALNNIYLIFFGLLGHLYFFYFINRQKGWYLTLAGVFLGCAGTVKWNGFAFLLGIYLFIFVIWGQKFYERFFNKTSEQHSIQSAIASIPVLSLIANLVLVPLITYSVLWIPHFMMNPEYGFWGIQKEILHYHERIGNTPDVHLYCSPWYSWLILWRPVAYYYETRGVNGIVYDVHSMANPILLWFSSFSMLVLIGRKFLSFFTKFEGFKVPRLSTVTSSNTIIFYIGFKVPQLSTVTSSNTIIFYIGLNYFANLLPWLKISRCTFFYHYMPAYLFSWFALAFILDNLLGQSQKNKRWLGFGVMGLILLGFLYWLPVFLGLPLLPQAFYLRMLLPSWI